MAQLYAGFSRVDITPPLGVEISGYYVKRIADGVLDNLTVNALALELDGKEVVLLSMDLLGLYGPEADAFRKGVAKSQNLPEDAVYIHCTHTHTGPKLLIEQPDSLEEQYVAYLQQKVQDAATLARADKKPAPAGVTVTNALDDALFEKLAKGETVVLNYSYMAPQNKWNVLSAIERFTPCIWDRGSNLGGIIQNADVLAVLGDDKYFDRNMQPLLDLGSKVNLDNWPCAVRTHIIGVDKPVRDRYRVQRDGVKGFVPEDTLRNFSHLFSFKVGDGDLIVSTMNVENKDNPVVANYLSYIVAHAEELKSDSGISAEDFKAWLETENSKEFRPEDTMNKMWTDDKIPVEKVLFWEDLNMNLAAIKA